MPSGAHYRVNQAGNPIPTGTQDVARVDIWQGNVIHLIGDSGSSQTGPSWTITSWPFGATHTQPTNPTSFDASFTPNTPGTYRVSYAVNDGAGANLRTFIFAVTRDSIGLIIDGGTREPAFGETDVDDTLAGNDRGYARSYELAMPFQVPTADNRDVLRTMKAVRHKQVHLLGRVSKGDGLGGVFYWDGASTVADDDTDVFQPEGLATGRWIRTIATVAAGADIKTQVINEFTTEVSYTDAALFKFLPSTPATIITILDAEVGSGGHFVAFSTQPDDGSAGSGDTNTLEIHREDTTTVAVLGSASGYDFVMLNWTDSGWNVFYLPPVPGVSGGVGPDGWKSKRTASNVRTIDPFDVDHLMYYKYVPVATASHGVWTLLPGVNAEPGPLLFFSCDASSNDENWLDILRGPGDTIVSLGAPAGTSIGTMALIGWTGADWYLYWKDADAVPPPSTSITTVEVGEWIDGSTLDNLGTQLYKYISSVPAHDGTITVADAVNSSPPRNNFVCFSTQPDDGSPGSGNTNTLTLLRADTTTITVLGNGPGVNFVILHFNYDTGQWAVLYSATGVPGIPGPPGVVMQTDGTDLDPQPLKLNFVGFNGLFDAGVLSISPPAPPGGFHEVTVYRQGVPTSSEVILRYRFASTSAVDWPYDLPGSQFDADTASTGDVSCTLKQNGSSIGTVRYNASATGVAAVAETVTWVAGDVLVVEAPGTADETLAGIAMTILGTR